MSKIYDLIFSKKHDLNSRIFRKLACFVLFVFNLFLVGLSGFLATESLFSPTVDAASRHGTSSLTSLPKDDDLSCEVRSLRSSIRSLTSLDRAYLQSPDED